MSYKEYDIENRFVEKFGISFHLIKVEDRQGTFFAYPNGITNKRTV